MVSTRPIFSEVRLVRITKLMILAMDEAAVQMRRLDSDFEKLEALVFPKDTLRTETPSPAEASSWTELQSVAWADVHFLAIAMGNVVKCFHQLGKEIPEDASFKAVEARFSRFIKEVKQLRNDLEHIYERADEGVTNLGNLVYGSKRGYQFGKRTIDLGPAFRETADAFFMETKNAVGPVLKKHGRKTAGPVYTSMTLP